MSEELAPTQPASDEVAAGNAAAARDDVASAPTAPPTTQPDPDVDAPPELPDVAIAAYDLGPEVGRGGMGKVIAARDRRLRRVLAVKIARSASGAAQARFAREALITARLQHPAIVPIHEAGRLPSGEAFYAMKLVDGPSLETLIDRARGLDERLALLPHAIAVVDALAFAHAQRVIHRDLKPNNVIVGEYGETIVIDWGLAKDLRATGGADVDSLDDDDDNYAPRKAAPGVTVEGAAMGTPHYMPPEQAAGERVDERADVYGLGALLYHLLAGAAPYQGKNLEAVIARVLAEPPVPLARRQPGVPADLIAIVDKAMARDPAKRYPNAGALADDLKRFYRGQLVAAHAYSRGELARRWVKRHRAVLAVAALAAVLMIGVGGVALWRVAHAHAETADRDRDARHYRALDLVELGREEVLGNRFATGAASLAEAYRLGAPGPALRVLLGDAIRHLRAQTGRIYIGGETPAIALAPDGKTLVTASGAPTALFRRVQLWDLDSGRVLAELGTARSFALSPDGAAVALTDGAVARIWRGGAIVATLASFDHDPDYVVWSPTGHAVATVGNDGTCLYSDAGAQLWCAKTDARLDAPAFSPDGSRVAIGDDIRDVATGTATAGIGITNPQYAAFGTRPGAGSGGAGSGDPIVVGNLHGLAFETLAAAGVVEREAHGTGDKRVSGIAVSHDGELAVARYDQEPDVTLFHHRGAPVELHAATRFVSDVVFSRDDARLATGGNDGVVRVWDTASGAELAVLDAGVEARALAFSADGKTLVCASGDGYVRRWDLGGLELPLVRPGTALFAAGAASPDGTRVVVAGEPSTIVDPRTGAVVATLPIAARIATFSPDGTRVVTVRPEIDEAATVWDAATGAKLFALTGSTAAIERAGFTPTGLWTVDEDGRGAVWDSRGARVAALDGRHVYGEPTASADGTRLLLEVGIDRMATYDTRDGHRVATIDIGKGPIAAAAINRDGSRIAVVFGQGLQQSYALARAGNAELWDAARGVRIASLGASTDLARFGPNDQLITGHADGVARIWDRDGRQLARLAGHQRQLTSAALSEDGALALTASPDGTVRLWDARTGHALAVQPVGGATANVTAAFAAGDRRVVALDGEGTTWTWAIPYEQRDAGVVSALLAMLVARDATGVAPEVTTGGWLAP